MDFIFPFCKRAYNSQPLEFYLWFVLFIHAANDIGLVEKVTSIEESFVQRSLEQKNEKRSVSSLDNGLDNCVTYHTNACICV